MRVFKNRKGVTEIHLFHETWRVGRLIDKKGKPLHTVIYSPDDKEYHVYGEDVRFLYSHDKNFFELYEYGSSNRLNLGRVKIYILTSILDKKENWCFDLKEKPVIGYMTKVIFDNGTIISPYEFDGEWREIEIPKNYRIGEKVIGSPSQKKIKPFCYKIN